MSLFLKISAAIVALLTLVVGAAALYLFTVFDANDYKAEIQALNAKDPQYITNQYLPAKLEAGDWI